MWNELVDFFKFPRNQGTGSGAGHRSVADDDGHYSGGESEVLASGQRGADLLAGTGKHNSDSRGDEEMSTTTTTGQAILAVLESDLLTSGGIPLLAFLTTVKANPDPINQIAAWVKLKGDLVGAVPGLEQTVIGQLDSIIIGKLSGLIQKAQAAAAPTIQPAVPTA